MKRLLLATTMIAASSAAMAADLPARNKGAAAPVAAQNWAGYYVGAKLAAQTYTDTQREYDPSSFDGWGSDFRAFGIRPGVTVGYDFQWSNFVAGVIADAAWYNLQKQTYQWDTSHTLDTTYPMRDVLKYQANLRARFGYAVGSFLPFVSVGGTLAAMKRSYQDTTTGGWYNFNANQIGLVFGGGVEYRLTSQVSVKVEYLKAHFGLEKPFTGNISTYGATTYQHSRLSTNEVLLGVNYRF